MIHSLSTMTDIQVKPDQCVKMCDSISWHNRPIACMAIYKFSKRSLGSFLQIKRNHGVDYIVSSSSFTATFNSAGCPNMSARKILEGQRKKLEGYGGDRITETDKEALTTYDMNGW